jgi:hypothetical protein
MEKLFLFQKHSTNADIHTRTITHPYEHAYAYSTPMSTSEKLSRLDLEIHEVGHQEHFVVDGDVASPERIISRKYNTHIKYRNWL